MGYGPLVLETLIKWGIPVIAAGLLGWFIKKIIDPKKRDQAIGVQTRKQREWDEAARNSDVLNAKCALQIQNMSAAIDKKFEQAEAASQQIDNEILAVVKDLKVSVTEIRSDLKDQKESQALLQEGVLDLHLHNLIGACKVYIERGYITPIELMQYNERLSLYHKLGGNGHMEIWDERIRALPLHEHDNING